MFLQMLVVVHDWYLFIYRFRNELLILCGYVGALLAIRREYNSIVPALYEYTR